MNRSRLRLALDPSVLMLAAVLWLGRGGDTAASTYLA